MVYDLDGRYGKRIVAQAVTGSKVKKISEIGLMSVSTTAYSREKSRLM